MFPSKNGTARAGQEYEAPPLVLAGAANEAMPFQELHDALCAALRGGRPALVLELIQPGVAPTLVFADGATAAVRRRRERKG